MHVQVALGFVEAHRRQLARFGIGEEFVAARLIAQASVAQAFIALVGVLRALLLEVVERLMVILEVGDFRNAAGILVLIQRRLPRAGIPCPVNVLFR
ncbi:hypothetical protein D3C81_1907250 [compost metagenome]